MAHFPFNLRGFSILISLLVTTVKKAAVNILRQHNRVIHPSTDARLYSKTVYQRNSQCAFSPPPPLPCVFCLANPQLEASPVLKFWFPLVSDFGTAGSLGLLPTTPLASVLFWVLSVLSSKSGEILALRSQHTQDTCSSVPFHSVRSYWSLSISSTLQAPGVAGAA